MGIFRVTRDNLGSSITCLGSRSRRIFKWSWWRRILRFFWCKTSHLKRNHYKSRRNPYLWYISWRSWQRGYTLYVQWQP